MSDSRPARGTAVAGTRPGRNGRRQGRRADLRGPSALATPANVVTIGAPGARHPAAVQHDHLRQRGARWAAVTLWVAPVPAPTGHRRAGWPAATAPPAPGRSSTRWPTRCWCSAPSSAAGGRSGVVLVAPRRHHRRAPEASASSLFRAYWGRRGLGPARVANAAKAKTVVQGLAIGAAVCSRCIADGSPVVRQRAVLCGRHRSCLDRRSSAGQYQYAPPVGRITPALATDHAGASALPRSRTDALRDRRGRHRAAARPDRRHQLVVDRRAARPRRASIRTCARPRSATTTGASSDALRESPSTAATPCSSAAASGRPRTTSPVT